MKALDQFKQNLEAKAKSAADAYKALVSKLASNDRKVADKVTQPQIAEALEAAGKDANDLERDVANEKRRLELWQIAKGRPAAMQRLQKAEHEAAEFNKRLQKTNRELIQEGQKFHGAVRIAKGQLGDINAAVRSLEELTGESVVWPDAEDAAA